MTEQSREEIDVPALTEGDKVIVPEVWLGRDVEFKEISGTDWQKFNPPTLAELRHAFFGGSDEYRQCVLSRRDQPLGERMDTEWTSTFLHKGKELIERPERWSSELSYETRLFEWTIEGGKITQVEQPPEGWVLEYDKPTGFPSRTTKSKDSAQNVFGDDASYFWPETVGLTIIQVGDVIGFGPFFVNATKIPSSGVQPTNRSLGARSCRRSGVETPQTATAIAEPHPSTDRIQIAASSNDEYIANVAALASRQQLLLDRLQPASEDAALKFFRDLGVSEPNEYQDAIQAFSGLRSLAMSSEGSAVHTWYLNLDPSKEGPHALYVHVDDPIAPIGFAVCKAGTGSFVGYYATGSQFRNKLGL